MRRPFNAEDIDKLMAATAPLVKPFKPLPFTLEQARIDPVRCRKLVGIREWEERVEVPLMKLELKEPRDLSDEKMYSNFLDIAFNVFTYEVNGRGIENLIKDASEDHRNNVVLLSLDEATKATSGVFGRVRRLCPDLGLHLAKDVNRLIDLLRFVARSGTTFPRKDDYHPVVCKQFDAFMGVERGESEFSLPESRAIRAMQTQFQHERNLFIGFFLWHILTLYQYKGEDYYPGVSSPVTPRIPLPQARFDQARSSLIKGSHDLERNKTLRNALGYEHFTHEYRSTKCETCHSCARFPEEIEGFVTQGKKFMYCPNLALGVKVPYCSRACQVSDFKEGDHRKYCGRSFSDLALPSAGFSIPPTEPPLPLLIQLHLLRLDQDPAYPKIIYEFRSPVFDYLCSPGAQLTLPFVVPIHSIKATKASSPLEGLLRRAAETRQENDVRNFIRQIFSLLPPPHILDRGVALRQVASDWNFTVEKVRNWFV
ncbi:hypothetical protein JCM5353_000659 [Sporobolomyces roseus]